MTFLKDVLPYVAAYLAASCLLDAAKALVRWDRRRAHWWMSFLQTLEENIPVAKGSHHVLRFAQYGSDEVGWDDRLCLEISLPSGIERFFVDDQDLRGSAEAAAARDRLDPGCGPCC